MHPRHFVDEVGRQQDHLQPGGFQVRVASVTDAAQCDRRSSIRSHCTTYSPPRGEPMAHRDLAGRRLGQFVLRDQIGEGGYGVAYRGEQPLLERDVVVKVLHERRRNDVAEARFLREAQLASRLDHPYAAHVYDSAVEEDGLFWIAMELVHGSTLADWLKTRGPMPLDQFVPFFECVAQVVHAAHERGIVHRDLKPSNVMVIEHGGRLFPKLLDFGIAKVAPVGELVPETGLAPVTESDE